MLACFVYPLYILQFVCLRSSLKDFLQWHLQILRHALLILSVRVLEYLYETYEDI